MGHAEARSGIVRVGDVSEGLLVHAETEAHSRRALEAIDDNTLWLVQSIASWILERSDPSRRGWDLASDGIDIDSLGITLFIVEDAMAWLVVELELTAVRTSWDFELDKSVGESLGWS